MNEVDEILLEQLHVARHIAKKMRKARKVMGPDPTLLICQEMNEKRIQFLESMLLDKTLLHKKVKIKKKKERDPDILARGIFHDWYRNVYIVTKVGYTMMVDSFQAYMSLFSNKKGKD